MTFNRTQEINTHPYLHFLFNLKLQVAKYAEKIRGKRRNFASHFKMRSILTGKTATHNPEGQIRGVGVGVLNDLKSLSH